MHITASISAYIAQSRILPVQKGRYSKLTEGVDDVPLWFEEYVKRRTGIDFTTDFVHDGTAAARTYAGAKQAAVIMVGTALGSGFPPRTDALRPLASDLRLVPYPSSLDA